MDPNGLYEVWQEAYFDSKPRLCMHGCSESEAINMVKQLNDMIILRRMSDYYDYKRIRTVKPKFEFTFPIFHFYHRCITDPMFVIRKVSHTGIITYLETQYSYDRATQRVEYYQKLFYRLNLLFVIHVERETHPWTPRCYTGMIVIANKAASNTECLQAMSYYEEIDQDTPMVDAPAENDPENTMDTSEDTYEPIDLLNALRTLSTREYVRQWPSLTDESPGIRFDELLDQIDEFINESTPLTQPPMWGPYIHRDTIIHTTDNVESTSAIDLSTENVVLTDTEKIIAEINEAFTDVDLFDWLLE